MLDQKSTTRERLTTTGAAHAADDDRHVGGPLIAVVIPAYKQPGYLPDAVHSVLRQAMRANIRTVVVNDGCPFEGTEEIGQLFRSAYPDEVFYLRKPNGGLSSARNYGIRFALNTWPSIQAVLPLDSDNALSPHTAERLWNSLSQAPADTGWVYQDLNFFGTEDYVWSTGIPFSTYRLFHDNFCDAGALVRRDVFDAGIWYDENMKDGYEDWEFYIRTSLAGFRAMHVPDTGFQYRAHGHSMLTDAQDKHRDIYRFIKRKHADDLRSNRLVQIEHEEMPRYALMALDADTVKWVTDPVSLDQPVSSVSTLLDAMVTSEHESRPKATYIPPITLLSTQSVIDRLQRLRVLPGIAFSMQRLISECDCAFLNFEPADAPYLLQVDTAEPGNDGSLMAIPTRRLIALARRRPKRRLAVLKNDKVSTRKALALRVGVGHAMHVDGQLKDESAARSRIQEQPGVVDATLEMLEELSNRLNAVSSPMLQDGDDLERRHVASNAHFAAQQQLNSGVPNFPYSGRYAGNVDHLANNGRRQPLNIWFTTAWIRLGGVDQVVVNLARSLAALNPAYKVHLVVTDGHDVEANPQVIDTFETITILTSDGHKKDEELVSVLAGADVIINEHSRTTYNVLPQLKQATSAPIVSHLHVVDPDPFGVPRGYPVLTSRQYEPLIDSFIVHSRSLKRVCMNLGVPDDKISIVPNAPVMHPPTVEDAIELARTKASREFSQEQPLQILFVGRFEEQKGFDRLAPVVESLQDLEVPHDFKLIGRRVLGKDDPAETIPSATFLPPTQDPTELAQLYAAADVLLLPSRWEGVPLTVLEAMAFGNIVVSTNVGAMDEVVEHGRTGYLVDSELPDHEISTAISRILAGIASGKLHRQSMREEAAGEAMRRSWHESATRLAALIEEIGLERVT